jgi:hypothetical protein
MRLHITYEDKREFLTQQSMGFYPQVLSSGEVRGVRRVSEFDTHTRISPDHWWTKLEKKNKMEGDVVFRTHSLYGMPVGINTLSYGGMSSLYQAPEPNGIRRSATMQVTSVDHNDRSISIQAIERRQQIEQLQREHRRHVQAHQEHMDEMSRRQRQAEEERARLEEERNRPRRPWERVRNFFR